MKKQIDLTKFHETGTIVMSGRPKGEKLRAELKLDRLDTEQDDYDVMVPDEVVSLNGSFFSGLFGPSVKKLNEAGFRAKYQFQCAQPVLADVEAGIREALKTSNPLQRSK